MSEPASYSPGVDGDHPDREAEWAELRSKYLLPADGRPASIGRGVHHTALLCADVERTIDFYQNVIGFPLTDLFQNRDYVGSTHFFFDIGNGNALAFFDFPGLGLTDYAEVLGGLHHTAISVSPEAWEQAKARLEAIGVELHIDRTSMYFRDPDGSRLELLADPLGEMYGQKVL